MLGSPGYRARALALLTTVALLTGCGVAGSAATPGRVQVVVADTEPDPPDMEELQQRLERYVEGLDGIWGIAVIDIESRRTAAVNGDEVYLAASTFKVPMAMYVLHEIDRGRGDLEERLRYTPVDWEGGTGIIQMELDEGKSYSIRELIELALVRSDNIATNMLLRRFGLEKVYAYMRQMGGKVTVNEEERYATTPREMAHYLHQAYSQRAFHSVELREFLFELLSRTIFQERIAAGVPEGVRVAHKIGTLPGVVNDVGLVTLPQRSFILSVYSKQVDEPTAVAAIAEITRIVVEFMQESLPCPSPARGL